MPNFTNPVSPAFPNIPLIEESDQVKGGLLGTEPSNKQAKLLLERTQYLKNQADTLAALVADHEDALLALQEDVMTNYNEFLDHNGVFSNIAATINVTGSLLALAVLGGKIYVLKPTIVEVYLESTGAHLSVEDFGVGILLDPRCIRVHNGKIYVLDNDPSVYKIQCFQPDGTYLPASSITLTGPSDAVCFIMDADHAYVLYAGQTPTNYLEKYEIDTGDFVRIDGFASGSSYVFTSMYMQGTIIYFTGIGSNNLVWSVDINSPTSFYSQSSTAFTCGVFVRGDRYYTAHSDMSQQHLLVRKYGTLITEENVYNLIPCVFMLFVPATRKVYFARMSQILVLTLEKNSLD